MLRAAIVLAGFLATLTCIVPARADHASAADGGVLDAPVGSSFDLSLDLGAGGFRLGGRVVGPEGYLGGAWLNGKVRRHGVRLDGGVDHGRSRHDFIFDGDLGSWFRRTKGVWGVTEL
jgi:hypothetical protein